MNLKQTSSDLAEMLNDASIDRIMAIDTNWQIIAWNGISEKITGIHKQALIGKQLFEAFPELEQDKEMVNAWNMAMQGYKSFLASAAGMFNRHYYENHFIPLTNENGEMVGVMNLMHDVSHRIKAERQLQKLNEELEYRYNQLQSATNDLAVFTSITGEKLKEPIRHIYLSLEFLIKNEAAKLSDGSKATLRRMQASLSRINLLLDDILALSAYNNLSQEFIDVDLQAVLEHTKKILQSKISEKQAVIESEPLPVICGSLQMLHYLFCNIIDNALKFQDEGNVPHINISSEVVSLNEYEGKVHKEPRQFLRIAFADNGIGFDMTDAKRIFNMFERLHPQKKFRGSGIGLTISQKIAEAHHGFIEAESEPGKGSTFHCYLAIPGGGKHVKLY